MAKGVATNSWIKIRNIEGIDPAMKYRVHEDAQGQYVRLVDVSGNSSVYYITETTDYVIYNERFSVIPSLEDTDNNLVALQLAVKVAIPGTHSSDILAAAKSFRDFLKGDTK